MSDWLEALEAECVKTGQAETARRLGVSNTMVSLVRRGCYTGSLTRIEALVRGTFMAETVPCPILETISRRECMENQTRPFAATNPTRVALWRACKECEHRVAVQGCGPRDGKGGR